MGRGYLFVFHTRAERGTAFNRRFSSNRHLALTGVLALQALVVYRGSAQAIFRTTDLALAD